MIVCCFSIWCMRQRLFLVLSVFLCAQPNQRDNDSQSNIISTLFFYLNMLPHSLRYSGIQVFSLVECFSVLTLYTHWIVVNRFFTFKIFFYFSYSHLQILCSAIVSFWNLAFSLLSLSVYCSPFVFGVCEVVIKIILFTDYIQTTNDKRRSMSYTSFGSTIECYFFLPYISFCSLKCLRD